MGIYSEKPHGIDGDFMEKPGDFMDISIEFNGLFKRLSWGYPLVLKKTWHGKITTNMSTMIAVKLLGKPIA